MLTAVLHHSWYSGRSAVGAVTTIDPAGRLARQGKAACGAFLLAVVGLGSQLGLNRSELAPHEVHQPTDGSYSYFLVGNRQDTRTPTRPGLVLKGGGTDIDESFRWLIERSGGGDFLVIRSTGTDAYNDYIYDMTSPSGLRPSSVATLIFHDRSASDDPEVLAILRNAEAIWIAGGNQAKHLARWKGSPVEALLRERVAGGIPLGGTSSGMAVLGDYIYSAESDDESAPHLSSTESLRDPYNSRITFRRDFLALPLLAGMILEPHFLHESRYGRMAAFLARLFAEGPAGGVRGIGVDRKTALLIEPDGTARVISHPDHPFGVVSVFHLDRPPGVCEPGRPLTVHGIRHVEFRPGDTFSLDAPFQGSGRLDLIAIAEGTPILPSDPTVASAPAEVVTRTP